MPPPSRLPEVPLNRLNESFEAHHQPPITARPDNSRRPRNLLPLRMGKHQSLNKAINLLCLSHTLLRSFSNVARARTPKSAQP